MVTSKVSLILRSEPLYNAEAQSDSLALHNTAKQGHIMINIHLWCHALLIISMLSPGRLNRHDDAPTATRIKDSADVIREIVTSCELLDPSPLLDIPLICQPVYTAAMVYLKGTSTLSIPL